ncbi:MAG TPA: Mor transcription activator family protein [Oleiagrimonas sp.]|nr:Mor transcription activator family protein [Oleiagrimonas sp.]
MSTNLERAATFLRDLADIAGRVLQDELSLPPAQAAEVGQRIARVTCDEHRGEPIYIPASLALKLEERDEAMYAFWLASGKDIHAVAKKFDITEKQAYERIRLYKAAAFTRAQGTLDLGDDG